jgi:hypothetical protein
LHLNCGGDTLLIPKFGRRHQASLDHRDRNRRHDQQSSVRRRNNPAKLV